MSLTSLLAQIEDGDAEPALSAQLDNAEQRVLAGEQRLKQMKEHLARLREIEGAAAQLTSATSPRLAGRRSHNNRCCHS
jgi:small-conductance mechanosensitive channel